MALSLSLSLCLRPFHHLTPLPPSRGEAAMSWWLAVGSVLRNKRLMLCWSDGRWVLQQPRVNWHTTTLPVYKPVSMWVCCKHEACKVLQQLHELLTDTCCVLNTIKMRQYHDTNTKFPIPPSMQYLNIILTQYLDTISQYNISTWYGPDIWVWNLNSTTYIVDFDINISYFQKANMVAVVWLHLRRNHQTQAKIRT